MSDATRIELALEKIHEAALKLRALDLGDSARLQIETIIACCEDKAPASITIMPTVSFGADTEMESAYSRMTQK